MIPGDLMQLQRKWYLIHITVPWYAIISTMALCLCTGHYCGLLFTQLPVPLYQLWYSKLLLYMSTTYFYRTWHVYEWVQVWYMYVCVHKCVNVLERLRDWCGAAS